MALTLAERIEGLLDPGYVLVMAIRYFFITVFEIIWVERSPLKIFQIHALRAKAFSRFWLAVTPPLESPEGPVDPSNSSFANLPHYLATASGTVLDIGPGSGTFVTYYNPPAITKIYAAEPGLALHPALQESARRAGVGDRYEILPCGGQKASLLPALATAGLLTEAAAKEMAAGQISEQGVFDTIVCIRVLCSVPDLEASLATLYALLRPGGRFIVCEHVVNPWWTAKGSFSGRAFQLLYTMLGWSFFMGDCHMDRDTATLLKKIGDARGGWESVELDKENEWAALPFTSGVYIKKS